MSTAVFVTSDDQLTGIEIPEVGFAGPQGANFIPIERAAEKLAALQDRDGKPLKGAPLESAARVFASSVQGLEVDKRKANEIEAAERQAQVGDGETIEEYGRRTAAELHGDNDAKPTAGGWVARLRADRDSQEQAQQSGQAQRSRELAHEVAETAREQEEANAGQAAAAGPDNDTSKEA